MTDHEKARHLFQTAGLAFPEIPEELAVKLKERGEWLFSTRDIEISPYDLWHYVEESDSTLVDDYAILCHSGNGANSVKGNGEASLGNSTFFTCGNS